jgi:proline iminopeptidase
MPKYVVCLLACLMATELSFSQTEKPIAPYMHIITSDGVKLYVKVRGRGTPCLYLHGGPGSGSYWLEKFSGDMLERHFQMIYLDQRGVARSSSPKDGNYSLDRMAQDFEEVRAALDIEKWVTLGHSFGGILQVGYAQRYPQVIRGMIMLNTSLDMNGLC